MKRAALVFLILTGVAACARDGSSTAPTGTTPPSTAAPPRTAETPTTRSGGDGRATPRTTTTTTTTSASATSGRGAAGGSVDDTGRVGTAGPALLSPAVAAVSIEVDRSPGARLHVDPRAVLERQLRDHGRKERVTAGGEDGEVAAQAVYTAADLRAITSSARQSRSAHDRPAIYVLVLEGRYEDESVIGVAFAATSFAVFPQRIGGGVLGTNVEAFEQAVLVHELGHLFGLVDLTGHGAFHEDRDHPGHSSSKGSVMYWAVEDISISNVFRGGPPREFDAADEEEMSRIRQG